MTNHLNYPYHRRKQKDSIIITFKDGHLKYSSCDFKESQVTYLCTSDYLQNATLIEYSHHKMTPIQFYSGYAYIAKEYLQSKIEEIQLLIDLVNQREALEWKQGIQKLKTIMEKEN